MRGTQMVRQWKIIRLMETHRSGISGNDLATELDIPLRTVYRDLEAIQEAGFGARNPWLPRKHFGQAKV